jgi:hypothetical protein
MLIRGFGNCESKRPFIEASMRAKLQNDRFGSTIDEVMLTTYWMCIKSNIAEKETARLRQEFLGLKFE